MSDIVERLRAYAADEPGGCWGCVEWGQSAPDCPCSAQPGLSAEAADEIERLRADCERLRVGWDWCDRQWNAEKALADLLVDAFAGTDWPCDCHGHHPCGRHAALDAHEAARLRRMA